jgi:hypothetical protein
LDQDDLDEIPTNESVLHKDVSHIKNCNDNTIEIANFKPTFNLNPLAKEFRYLDQGFDLNGTTLNEEIYNPDTSKYVLSLAWKTSNS